MINLIEHEDDIYLDCYIDSVRRHQDKGLAFDQDAYEKMRQIIIPVIETRLVDILIGISGKTIKNIAEAKFREGYEFEKGLFCEQNYARAFECYTEADQRGLVEAKYRLGWLLENDLVTSSCGRSCDDYYEQAAEAGNMKATLAKGQRLLFGAKTLKEVYRSILVIEAARHSYWPESMHYLSIMKSLLRSRESLSHEKLAGDLSCFLPLPGHQPKNNAIVYHEDAEPQIRLAKYCHHHNVEAGTFFLSWCHLIGLCLQKDAIKARNYALQFVDTDSADLLFYIAWIYLSDNTLLGTTRALHLIRQAAEKGLYGAQVDLSKMQQLKLMNPDRLRIYLKTSHEPLEIEKFFQHKEPMKQYDF